MNNYKKITAALMGLLISVSAAVPAMAVYADNEETATEAIAEESEDSAAVTAENETEEEVYKESGDYVYMITDEGTVCITACRSDAEDVEIPSEIDGIAVTEIGGQAFLQSNIKKLTIPASVTSIAEENPFCPMLFLEEIIVDEANENYIVADGVLYTKDMKTLVSYPVKKKGASFTIPDSIETIGIAAIYGTELEEIIIPDSVTSIKRHCFNGNENLKKIDMSNTVIEQISPMCFADCINLTEVIFSESTTYIEVGGFMNCEKLENITLPSKLEYIGQNAFLGTSVKKIIIPDTVTNIGYCAFGYDKDEKPMKGVTIIGSEGSMAEIYASDTDTDNDYANDFTFMDFTEFERREEYNALDRKFVDDFEYAVVDGEGMITACIAVGDTVTVPSEIDGIKITSLYYDALIACDAPVIILPDTIKTIGDYAFPQNIEEITIPSDVTFENEEEFFLKYQHLRAINVLEGDGKYSSQDGVLYNKDKSLLIAYPAMKLDENFVIPETVKEIAKSGFCYNINLKSVELPAVEIVGEYAFEGCTSLTDAKLSDSLKEVRRNAFLGCYNMLTMRVPASVDSISEYAFGYDYDEELAADIQQNMEQYAQSGQSVIMPYSVIEGFKMYVDEDSLAHRYAVDNNIEVVLNTVAVGKKNVDKNFLYVIIGAAIALVLGFVGFLTGKGISKKKKEKAAAQRKAKSAEKLAEKNVEESEESNSEEEAKEESDEDK
ncbi:MAG: leucine-rich repeat protein [Ruminococcus sp.]|nr:leucine-rich repeat protein [Ruminococcus sp.]